VAPTNTGPGRAQRKGRSVEGRTTAKGGPTRPTSRVGRYRGPEETGRYTPPTPRSVRRSSPWLGGAILLAFALGVLVILLNYLSALPGSVSVWYLVAGLVLIFGGFLLATRYH
jgi:VIT1/CCC1 family predicted Fe2+/Mn2+ transporter